jgi:hypothetical protein
MEILNSCKTRKRTSSWNSFWIASLSAFFSVLFTAAGCGAPGEPSPPSPPIPVAVTDLKASQLGDAVLLTFTLPRKSTLGLRLTEMPTLEVWRGALRPDGTPDPRSFHLADTIPGPILSGYVQDGKVSYPDPVQPDELRARSGETALYRVRTRVSERKDSADSNQVSVDLYPVPRNIDTLEAQVSEKSIQLKWAAPTSTSAGAQLPPIQEFHVYRGELDPTSTSVAEKDLHAGVWRLPVGQIGVTTAPEYQDSNFDFGKTYAYVVRTVISEGGAPLESGDSRPVILTPKDTFPPAAPHDVVAAVLPRSTAGASVVDLSWTINLETDIAGYRVYRSESENERGELLTPELLPTPSYRDATVTAAHHYWYKVTAVDRAGNESAPSAVTLVETK